MYKAVKENDGTYSIRYSKHGGNWEVVKLGVRGCNVGRIIDRLMQPAAEVVYSEGDSDADRWS